MGQALRRDQGGGDTRAPAPANGEDATPTRALAKRDEAISTIATEFVRPATQGGWRLLVIISWKALVGPRTMYLG